MAAKRLLGFFQWINGSPFKNASTQVSIFDYNRMNSCLDNLRQNSEVFRKIYDDYAEKLASGELDLSITSHTLDMVEKEMDHFDSMILKLCDDLNKDEEILMEKKTNIRILQQEVNQSRKKFEKHKMASSFRLSECQKLAYQRALAINQILNFRRERILIELKINQTNMEIDNNVNEFNEEEERFNNLLEVRENFKHQQETDLATIMRAWEKRKERFEILQALAHGENMHQLLPKLLLNLEIENWAERDMDLQTLKADRQLLQEQILDQEEQKDVLQIRNEELRHQIQQHEETLSKLMKQETEDGDISAENREGEDAGGDLEISPVSHADQDEVKVDKSNNADKESNFDVPLN